MTAPLIRLADRIRTVTVMESFDPIALDDTNTVILNGLARDIRAALVLGAPVIVGDAIAEYYYAGTDKEHWQLKTDFPCLVPPFMNFWIEWAGPSTVRSEVYGTVSADISAFPFCGALVTVRPAAAASTLWGLSNLDAFDGFRDGATWCWRFQPVGFIHDYFAIPAGDYWIATDATGNVTNYVCTSYVGGNYVDTLGWQAPLFIHPALLTITFLNLKNGALTPAALHAPEKFAKHFARKHELPLVRFHTVVVDSSKTSKPTLPGAGSDRAMPVHLVRGTLVTYADEDGKRLFGKLHGTFFRPPHTRGNAREGIALHDYTVKAPKKASVA